MELSELVLTAHPLTRLGLTPGGGFSVSIPGGESLGASRGLVALLPQFVGGARVADVLGALPEAGREQVLVAIQSLRQRGILIESPLSPAPAAEAAPAEASEPCSFDLRGLPGAARVQLDPQLHLVAGFLAPEVCRALCAFYEEEFPRLQAASEHHHLGQRAIELRQLPEGAAGDQVRAVFEAAQAELERLFGVAELALDNGSMVRWVEGMAMEAHVDREWSASPGYTALVYLNEELEGGATVFDELGVAVQPARGLLVAYPFGKPYVHRVAPVVSGYRYTCSMWFLAGERRELSPPEEESLRGRVAERALELRSRGWSVEVSADGLEILRSSPPEDQSSA